MRVAIPVFQSKISPRFDSTQEFVLLEIEKNKVMKREDLPTKGWPLSAKLKQIVDLSVDTLICGGIDLESMKQLNFSGIKVYSWITGEVDDVVACYLSRGLESGIILGARGRRKGRWRFCSAENHVCHMTHSRSNPTREGVNIMPKGDGTGPRGQGVGGGRGAGCARKGQNGKGADRGKGGGAGRCRANGTGSGRQAGNKTKNK
jgi:predicted Fe-Mo cluster-binding NifX family protein